MFKEYSKFLKSIEKNKAANTLRSYQTTLDRFIDHFTIETCANISELTRDDITDYMDHLKDDGLSDASVNSHLRIIKVFVNWLYDGEHIAKNPVLKVKKVKEDEKIKPILTEEEFGNMLSACTTYQDKAILGIMYYAGLRRSEVVKVKVNDIYPVVEKGKEVWKLVVHGKGGSDVEVPLNSMVVKYYKQILSNRTFKSEWLFVTSDYKHHSITSETVRLHMKSLALAAGIDPERVEAIGCHTFRRTFICNLLNNGVSSLVAQKLARHKTVNTTQRYAVDLGGGMKNAIENQIMVGD